MILFRFLIKIIKWLLIGSFVLLIIANAFIFFTGRTYLYKAVASTYLAGQTGPGILDKDFFPYRTIVHNQPQPWPLHHRYNQNNIPADLLDKLNQIQTTSFLMIKNDSLYFEKYWNGFDSLTVSNSFSVAKSIVSLLIGIAIQDSLIKSIDQPVADFLEEFNTETKKRITLRHLLSMSSGSNWIESGGNPLSHNAEAYYSSDLEKVMNKIEYPDQPGKKFYYQSGNTQILGFVLEKVTGKTLSEYASEKLWQPLGAENDAYWSLDKEEGYEKAYCCIYSTARDFARIGKLMLHNGKWNNQQIVPAAYIKECITLAPLLEENGEPNKKYGLSWWITTHRNENVFYARGILGQYIICIPSQNLIIVRTGHERGVKYSSDHPSDVYLYIDVANKLLGK